MLNGLMLALVCAAAAACSPGEPPATADTEVDLATAMTRLQDRRAALATVESEMNLDAAAGFWAKDAILHVADRPPVVGRMLIRDFYHEFFAGDVVAFERESHEVRLAKSGELAYSLGQHRFQLIRDGEDLILNGKYLAVWKLIDGVWMLVAVSLTDDSDVPTPVLIEDS